MRRSKRGASADGSASLPTPSPATLLAAIAAFVFKTGAIAEVEVRKLRHDPLELLTRAVQPVLWLMMFGEVFSRARTIPTGPLPYLAFAAPGILAQSVLFIAIFYGIAVIWERDLGIVQKYLVSPTPRAALVLGKGLSAGVRGLSQAAIVYVLAVLLHVRMNWTPLALLSVVLLVVLGSVLFSTLSLIIACIVKSRERFMGIGQVLTMPLFFASSAIYPLAIMPSWLKLLAHVNPLTFEVDALRAVMPAGGASVFGLLTDFTILLAATILLVIVGSALYPRVAT